MPDQATSRQPVGWPLLMTPDENGSLRFPDLETSVRESIQVILATKPGEQLMHPEFGAGIDNFVYQTNTINTRRRIRDAVAGSLSRWEPRIILDRLDVLEVNDRPEEIRVELYYRLRRTGTVQTLGVTLSSAPR